MSEAFFVIATTKNTSFEYDIDALRTVRNRKTSLGRFIRNSLNDTKEDVTSWLMMRRFLLQRWYHCSVKLKPQNLDLWDLEMGMCLADRL